MPHSHILPPERLDKVIHEPGRLGIVASLAARGAMSFNELKDALGMTDGNLSTHAKTLQETGYIGVEKTFVGRKPRTTMTLTPAGQAAFRRYVDYLERIVTPAEKRPDDKKGEPHGR